MTDLSLTSYDLPRLPVVPLAIVAQDFRENNCEKSLAGGPKSRFPTARLQNLLGGFGSDPRVRKSTGKRSPNTLLIAEVWVFGGPLAITSRDEVHIQFLYQET